MSEDKKAPAGLWSAVVIVAVAAFAIIAVLVVLASLFYFFWVRPALR
jgi:hypothetical protein